MTHAADVIAIDFETASLSEAHTYGTVHCMATASIEFGMLCTELFVGREAIAKELRRIKQAGLVPVAHNASFDLAVCRTQFGVVFDDWHCTQLLSYSLKPSSNGHSLDDLAKALLGKNKLTKPSFDKYTPKMGTYCQKDAELCLELYMKLSSQLRKDEQAWDFYRNVDCPYQAVIVEMQMGAAVDTERLAHLDRLYSRYLRYIKGLLNRRYYSWPSGKTIEGNQAHVEWLPITKQYQKTSYSMRNGVKVWAHCVLDLINFNSSDQKVRLLRQEGVPKSQFKVTPTGKLSVDKDALSSMSSPLAKLLNKLSASQHKYDGFVTPLITKQVDGRIYASFNQMVTATRRLSSSSPNLQNIPRKGRAGAMFREVFRAPEGFTCIVGDLDRIELVVLAYFLEQHGLSTYMADAVREGQDLHTINRDMWGLPQTPEGRDIAKTTIFALIYGAGDEKLAAASKISKKEMASIRAAIYAATKLDRLKEQWVKEAARNNGLFRDVFGARYVVRGILSHKPDVVAEATRQVVNYKVQGSAGSIFKELQLRAYDKYRSNPRYSLLRQQIAVHDEAFYICPIELADEAVTLLNGCFNSNDILVTKNGPIPIRCAFQAGRTWRDAK